MYGHKSFLRLGPLNDASIQGLYKEGLELESCNYGFSQGVDNNGKAQTEVRGGAIDITFGNVPTTEMLQWALSSKVYKDGTIVICDDNNMPLEKIGFQQAACINMEIGYSQKGKGYISTKLTLQARRMVVGDTSLENRWTGFDE